MTDEALLAMCHHVRGILDYVEHGGGLPFDDITEEGYEPDPYQ